MKKVLNCLIFVSLIPALGWSSVQCPVPHPDYQKLLENLYMLVKTVADKKDPKCTSVTKELEDLSVIYSTETQELMKKVTLAQQSNTALTPDELELTSTKIQGTVTKIGGFVKLLQSVPDCMTNSPSMLSTLANITQEVTKVASMAAGPYGFYVTVGGAGVAGILMGIDALKKIMKEPYDFTTRPDRDLFLSTICAYHAVRQEMNDLANPSERRILFEKIHNNIRQTEKKLAKFEPRCIDEKTKENVCYRFYMMSKKMARIYLVHEEAKGQFKKVKDGAGRTSAVEMCGRISDMVHEENSGLVKLFKRMLKTFDSATEALKVFATELSSVQEIAPKRLTTAFKDAAKLRNGNNKPGRPTDTNPGIDDPINDPINDPVLPPPRSIPSVTCNSKTTSELTQLNSANIEKLEKVLVLFDAVVAEQMKYLEEKGKTVGEQLRITSPNDPMVLEGMKTMGELNPVKWLRKLQTDRDWVKKQMDRMDSLAQGDNDLARAEIASLQINLESQVYQTLAGQFLVWEKGRLNESYGAFLQASNGEARSLRYKDLAGQNLKEILESIEKNKVIDRTKIQLAYSSVSRLLPHINLIDASYQGLNKHCTYFSEAGFLTDSIYGNCQISDLLKFESIVNAVRKGYLEPAQKFVSFAIATGAVKDVDSAKELLKRVRDASSILARTVGKKCEAVDKGSLKYIIGALPSELKWRPIFERIADMSAGPRCQE